MPSLVALRSQALRALRAASNMRSISARIGACAAVPCQLGELLLIGLELGQQRIAVGQRDVAPHFGRAAGNASEIAESRWRRSRTALPASGRVGDHVHQRVGKHVRQVAHCGEHAVVTFRRSFGTTRAPHACHIASTRSTASALVFRQGRDHHVSAMEQACAGGIYAGQFGAGDRMSRHNGRQVPGSHAPHGCDEILLRAARVGDQCSGSRVCGERTPARLRSAAPAPRAEPYRRPSPRRAMSATTSSITPSSSARSTLARPRPTPMTCRTRPARLSAAATDPPIRPTPMTTSLSL